MSWSGPITRALTVGAVAASFFLVSATAQTDVDVFDQAAAEGHRLQALVVSLSDQVVTLEATVAERDATILALQARIDELEATTDPCDVRVAPGVSINQALQAAPEGAVICLSGTYTVTSPVNPRTGQSVVGPATIVGSGALDVFTLKGSPNVTLVDLDISGAERHGVTCEVGTTIIGGRLHDNAKDGTGCDLDGLGPVLVDGVEIDHNGSDAWLGKGAAGIKWFHSHGVTVTNSYVHDNYGNGVWCDAQCGDFTVTNNRIEGNFRKGVFYEKGGESDMAVPYVGYLTVTGNIIADNDTENKPAANAGVAVYASKNAVIDGNTFGGNTRAIIVRNDPARVADDKHGWIVSNVTVSNNTLAGDEIVGCDVAGVTCSGNVT